MKSMMSKQWHKHWFNFSAFSGLVVISMIVVSCGKSNSSGSSHVSKGHKSSKHKSHNSSKNDSSPSSVTTSSVDASYSTLTELEAAILAKDAVSEVEIGDHYSRQSVVKTQATSTNNFFASVLGFFNAYTTSIVTKQYEVFNKTSIGITVGDSNIIGTSPALFDKTALIGTLFRPQGVTIVDSKISKASLTMSGRTVTGYVIQHLVKSTSTQNVGVIRYVVSLQLPLYANPLFLENSLSGRLEKVTVIDNESTQSIYSQINYVVMQNSYNGYAGMVYNYIFGSSYYSYL